MPEKILGKHAFTTYQLLIGEPSGNFSKKKQTACLNGQGLCKDFVTAQKSSI
jgi:hypothetical protein